MAVERQASGGAGSHPPQDHLLLKHGTSPERARSIIQLTRGHHDDKSWFILGREELGWHLCSRLQVERILVADRPRGLGLHREAAEAPMKPERELKI